MKKETQGSELLQSLEQAATEELKLHFSRLNVFEEKARDKIAAEIGCRLADFLSLSWGGQQLYIPKDNKRRAAIIYGEFDGTNVADLARKYGVCVQTVYKIIKRERKRRNKQQNTQQGSLLDIIS